MINLNEVLINFIEIYPVLGIKIANLLEGKVLECKIYILSVYIVVNLLGKSVILRLKSN